MIPTKPQCHIAQLYKLERQPSRSEYNWNTEPTSKPDAGISFKLAENLFDLYSKRFRVHEEQVSSIVPNPKKASPVFSLVGLNTVAYRACLAMLQS